MLVALAALLVVLGVGLLHARDSSSAGERVGACREWLAARPYRREIASARRLVLRMKRAFAAPGLSIFATSRSALSASARVIAASFAADDQSRPADRSPLTPTTATGCRPSSSDRRPKTFATIHACQPVKPSFPLYLMSIPTDSGAAPTHFLLTLSRTQTEWIFVGPRPARVCSMICLCFGVPPMMVVVSFAGGTVSTSGSSLASGSTGQGGGLTRLAG
jgi:hypothetical protein